MFQRLIVDPVNSVFLRYNQWTLVHPRLAWAWHLLLLAVCLWHLVLKAPEA